MPKRSYFTQTIPKVLTDTTIDYIEHETAEEGEELHYEKIGATDLDNTCTIRIGIKRGNDYVWLETLTVATAGVYYSPTRPIIVTQGNALVAGFMGITANDKCVLNVNGYRVKNA